MSAGGRGVVAAFALAVAAALGAVSWLVFSSGPHAEVSTGKPSSPPPAVRPSAKPTGKAAVPPGPRPPGTPRVPKDRPKPPVLEILGKVLGPSGEPVAGAGISVFPPPSEESGSSTAPHSAGGPGADPEALRELFALDPEEVKGVRPWTGVPPIPAPGPPPREEARGDSGEDGTFRIQVRRRGPFRLQARKEGLGQAVASAVNAGGEPVVLRLGSSVDLEGRVVAGTEPVEGAVVVVRSGTVEKGATTAAGGAFRVEDLPPGKYAVTAGAAGHALTTLASVEIPLASGPLEIVLAGGYSVRVTVMRWEAPPSGWKRTSGVPLPPGPVLEGAQVLLYRRAGGYCLSAVTGPDGQARFDRLGEGAWRMGVRKEGFCVGFSKELRFKPGSPPEESREVRLEPAVATPIRVQDEAGNPVRNARLYTGGSDQEFDERHSRLVGRTDDEGAARFTFDDGVPWKSVVWVVPEDGSAAVMLEPEDSSSGKEEKVVVRPGRLVQGTVTDAEGKPVAGATVTLDIYDDDRDLDIELIGYTDAAGRYRFPAVPFGDVDLEVEGGDEWETDEVDMEVRDNPLVRDFKLGK